MTAQPRIAPQIFRAYDIRGIVGAGLDESSIELIGRVIGSEALDQGERALLTAADARLSSPALSRALLRGILSTGCDVCDLGVVPTPLLYFGAEVLPIHSGVMLTGSHNPKEYNGIKIVLRQRALADGQIRQLQQRIEQDNFHHGAGAFTRHDINAAYIERIVSDIQFQKRWRVVLDAGNGVTGLVAPQLFTQLGCEVIPLYCELDGNFPHHHPDPSRADCLQDLRAAVLRHGADLGLAFDGDGDRIGLVSAQGDIIDTDHLLFAFVSDLLPRYPGARVVYDIKSSRHLARQIHDLGGEGVLCKSGHSFVKQKMQESGALLGGEYSAHVFFKQRWYGFDDGMYAGARFLELMDQKNNSAQELVAEMPPSISTPELFAPVSEQDKFALMALLHGKLQLPGATLNQLDGIRADFSQGWGLIRASNTTPNLVLRFEADDAAALQAIQNLFARELRQLLPALTLPF